MFRSICRSVGRSVQRVIYSVEAPLGCRTSWWLSWGRFDRDGVIEGVCVRGGEGEGGDVRDARDARDVRNVSYHLIHWYPRGRFSGRLSVRQAAWTTMFIPAPLLWIRDGCDERSCRARVSPIVVSTGPAAPSPALIALARAPSAYLFS